MPELRSSTGTGERRTTAPTQDQEWLARFLAGRDEEAFAALMQRHGPMVLGVCERVLHNAHDAQDACQAVFLVLARKAHSVRKQGSLASWLHGVALHVSRKLQRSLARRTAREAAAAAHKPTVCESGDLSWREVQRVVDDELHRLPHIYQAPLVLCYLQGRTQDEAARELGWTIGALRGRLERGREKLRGRLARRGVTGASAVAITALVPALGRAALPPDLIVSTAQASVATAQGDALPAAVPDRVAALVAHHVRSSVAAWLTAVAAVAVPAAFLAIWLAWTPAEPAGQAPTAIPWTPTRRLQVPELHLWSVAFSPDGKWVAGGAGGILPSRGELRVWDALTGELRFKVVTARSVRCVTYAPDGTRLATAEHDGAVRVRDAANGAVLLTLESQATIVDAATFSADGKMLAASCWNGTVKIWDIVSGKEIGTLPGTGRQVFGVAFCGAGQLAAGGADGKGRIHDIADSKTRFLLDGHDSTVHWLAAAPDGKTVATASWDKTVRLWDATTGNALATLRGHTEPVLTVAFAPQGKRLASASGLWGQAQPREVDPAAGEAIVWDLDARQARARLPHNDRVFGVAFSPDGNTLATACWNGTVTLWDAPRDDAPRDDAPRDVPAPAPPDGLEFVGAAQAEEAPPAQAYAEEFHPTLKVAEGAMAAFPSLELFGPEAAECVKAESAGLRLTLPEGYPRQRSGTGVVTDFGMRGNFEITVSYEMRKDSRPGSGGNPTELRLVIVPSEPVEPEVWHKTTQNRAVLARQVATPTTPPAFLADLTKWNPELPRDQWGNEIFNKIEAHDTQHRTAIAKSGRLRLLRRGTLLYFLTSEESNQAFTVLHKGEFGTKDLRNVRILATTGGPKASFDAMITDVRIRADGFVRASEPEPLPATPVSPLRWRLVLLAIGAPVLAVAFALSAWLARRRRTPAPAAADATAPAASLAFECPGCAKRLKVRREHAGKRVKCPQCGQAVDVPIASEDLP